MYKNKAGQERYLEEELLSLKNEKAVKSVVEAYINEVGVPNIPNLCLLYTSPSPRDS